MKPAAPDADDHLAMFRPRSNRAGAGATARVGVALLSGCLALSACVSVRPLELVPPERVAQTSLVLDADGRTVAALHGPEDRTAARLEEVSRWMRLAVVDAEDSRFWRHGGWTGWPWPGRRRGTWSGGGWWRVGRPSPSST
jgi:membrane peptidoglycan carboxypeptidase